MPTTLSSSYTHCFFILLIFKKVFDGFVLRSLDLSVVVASACPKRPKSHNQKDGHGINCNVDPSQNAQQWSLGEGGVGHGVSAVLLVHGPPGVVDSQRQVRRVCSEEQKGHEVHLWRHLWAIEYVSEAQPRHGDGHKLDESQHEARDHPMIECLSLAPASRLEFILILFAHLDERVDDKGIKEEAQGYGEIFGSSVPFLLISEFILFLFVVAVFLFVGALMVEYGRQVNALPVWGRLSSYWWCSSSSSIEHFFIFNLEFLYMYIELYMCGFGVCVLDYASVHHQARHSVLCCPC